MVFWAGTGHLQVVFTGNNTYIIKKKRIGWAEIYNLDIILV